MRDAPDAGELALFRDTVRRFVADEIAPHHAAWEEAGRVARDLWPKAGAAGLLCTTLPEAWGGAGGRFEHAAIVTEEVARAGASGVLFYLHSEIVAPYILHYGSEALKRRWLPEMAAGRAIGAIAMTEPSTGSDVRAIRTRARRDGDRYILSGQKTFISNGQTADLFMVAARTGAGRDDAAISLFLVEGAAPGFRRGRVLDKVGMKAQDTSEIFLDDVAVPAGNLLGEEGRGFACLVAQLPQERLMVAIAAVAAAEGALAHTVDHVRTREAFGQTLAQFQNTRFEIGDIAAELKVARVFVDWCVAEHAAGRLDGATAAMAKLWTTETQCRVIDRCLQLHGGYGYMREYPIARAWADARVQRIYGGTSEIMKEIVARSVLGPAKAGRG